MFVTDMPINKGMLFKWESEELRPMWMKNTYIPLDIFWVNSQYQIVHIHENAQILDLTPLTSPLPAKYVIELNAGIASANQILIGDMVKITPLFARQ